MSLNGEWSFSLIRKKYAATIMNSFVLCCMVDMGLFLVYFVEYWFIICEVWNTGAFALIYILLLSCLHLRLI